ncbi:hypothetical protein [Hydrogenovibrio halophilus]|uniref:hypothetical protein n=1 Tax=Hydrogenovibrio halophilus TaxID=373391 RepID=UPI000376C11D|nr:hypothetical protein [Hydrogenovibrio halophilus]
MSRTHWIVGGALLMALNLTGCASYDAEKAKAEAERKAAQEERAERSHRQMDRALDKPSSQ